MTEAELRARLSSPVFRPVAIPRGVPTAPPPADRIAAPAHSDDAVDLADQPLVPAAVLVPLMLGPTISVLLTKRTEHLSRHAGQVSFPGGRIDPTDGNAEEAALREAWEEIALSPDQVEIVGRLGAYVTGTGYQITPVVGLVPAGVVLTPSPDEVAAVFNLPLSVVLDPAAPRRQSAEYRGRWREYWVWPHPEHFVWGATAAILVQLGQVLRGEFDTQV